MKSYEDVIGSIIDNAATAFVSYVDIEGFPVTKAMLKPRERTGIREFWFSTNTSSNKVKRFQQNRKASVYFTDERCFLGVSLIGTMDVLETPDAKTRIWRNGDELYYKLGVTDPDYCVLRFVAEKCRFYSNFKSEDIIIE